MSREQGVVAIELNGIAGATGIEEFLSLPKYIRIQREAGQVVPEATEKFCGQLVSTLANPEISVQYRNFLMAHLGLREITVDSKREVVGFQPSAKKGHPFLVIGAREGESGLNFDDIKFIAGKLILDFARDPDTISQVSDYGCSINQLSKERRLSLVSVQAPFFERVQLEAHVITAI